MKEQKKPDPFFFAELFVPENLFLLEDSALYVFVRGGNIVGFGKGMDHTYLWDRLYERGLIEGPPLDAGKIQY